MTLRNERLLAASRIVLSTLTFAVAGLVLLPTGHSQVEVYPWSLVATYSRDVKYTSCITCQPVYQPGYTYSTPAECKVCHMAGATAFPEETMDGESPCLRAN